MGLFVGLAIAGGIVGAAQFKIAKGRQEAEANAKRKELEEQQKELKRAYEAKKKEDTDLANFKDKQLNKTEQNLSEEVQNSIDSLQLQEESNAISTQNQQITNDSETGTALANVATSGIRSGSVMESIDRSDAYAAELLEANRDAMAQQTEIAYKQTQLGLAQNMDNVTSNRYQNNATRKSYEAGGYNYEKFKASYDQMSRAIYDLRTDVKGNAYDLNKLNFWDGLSAIFSGGSTLVGLGSSYKTMTMSS